MRSTLTGFSLIEIMLVLTLSSGILLSGFYILQHTSGIYHTQQQRLHGYANKRYAKYILSKSIRMAGFLPCSNLNQQLHAPAAIATVPSPAWLKNPIANNDVLSIHFAQPSLSYLNQAMKNPHDVLQIEPPLKRYKKQLFIITDCHRLEFFSDSKPLQHAFPKQSLVSYLQTQWFYLRSSTDGKGTALFMRDHTGRSEEIINGVTQFKVFFSIGDQHFIESHNLQLWRNATAVKIELHYTNERTQDFIIRLRNR